jgi:hypothetical protein
MTTSSNHDEVLDTLKAILAFMRWIGVPLVLALASGVALIVADHYAQVVLEKDRDEMKPRVTRLWLERHPEVTAQEIVR